MNTNDDNPLNEARTSAAAAQRWLGLAALVSRNIVPIIGLFFLDWHAANLIVLYFTDFIADVGTCFTLLILLDPEFKTVMPAADTAGGRIKRTLSIILAIVSIAAVFAFVFGMPLFGMFAMDPDLSLGRLLSDMRFRNGLLLHLLLSSWTFYQVYRYFLRMRDIDAAFDVSVSIRGRFQFVLGRWLAVYVTGLTIPFYATLMVVAFCATTIYFELFPRRVEKMFDPSPEEPPQTPARRATKWKKGAS